MELFDDITDKVGEGSYGTVYKTSNPGYVVKLIRLGDSGWYEYIFVPEVDISCRLESPYLVKCRGILEKIRKYIFGYVLEYCDYNFMDFMKTNTSITNLKRVLLSLAMGIKHLHDNGYYHLDISFGNLLCKNVTDPVSGESIPIGKVCDFGLSNAVHSHLGSRLLTRQTRVTSLFRPPESIILSNEYSNKTDVWSLGVNFLCGLLHKIHYSTICRDCKFGHDESKINHGKIQNYILLASEQFPDKDKLAFIDLMLSMLEVEPRQRATITDVVNHSFWDNREDLLRKFGPCIVKPPDYIPGMIMSNVGNFNMGIEQIFTFYNYFVERKAEDGTTISLEHICLCFDLYLRLYPHFPHNSKHIARVAMVISLLIYLSLEDILYLRIFDSEQLRLILRELPTMHIILGGIIKHTYFYDKCETAEEVILTLFELFKRYEQNEQYQTDATNYIEYIRNKYIVLLHKKRTNKNVSVDRIELTFDKLQKQYGAIMVENDIYYVRLEYFQVFFDQLYLYAGLEAYIFFDALDVLLTYITSTTDEKKIEVAAKSTLDFVVGNYKDDHVSLPFIESNTSSISSNLLLSTEDIDIRDELDPVYQKCRHRLLEYATNDVRKLQLFFSKHVEPDKSFYDILINYNKYDLAKLISSIPVTGEKLAIDIPFDILFSSK